jgi:hypothetical protein
MSHSISHFRQRELASQRMLCLSGPPELWEMLHRMEPRARRQPELVATIEEARESPIRRAAGWLTARVGGLRGAWRRSASAAV